ncbi:hypothetical protein KVP95_21020, partial [Escherichia coli]|uniref:hypothetical protein n=1 Tax=Escherichia coli TaxID=562 RepID=UPI001F060BEA
SGAGRTSDGNGSHASTLKSPSYTKSVSWQHYPISFTILSLPFFYTQILPGGDKREIKGNYIRKI